MSSQAHRDRPAVAAQACHNNACNHPAHGPAACSICGCTWVQQATPTPVEPKWICDGCKTVYAEYVNGCPKCWEQGLTFSVRAVPAAQPVEATSQEPPLYPTDTPCCGYKYNARGDSGPIFWNQFNKIVQCHNCGQAFSPIAPVEGPREAQLQEITWRNEAERILENVLEGTDLSAQWQEINKARKLLVRARLETLLKSDCVKEAPENFTQAPVEGPRCKYGDTGCPCQDGDPCHYEGENPMKPVEGPRCDDRDGPFVCQMPKGHPGSHWHTSPSGQSESSAEPVEGPVSAPIPDDLREEIAELDLLLTRLHEGDPAAKGIRAQIALIERIGRAEDALRWMSNKRALTIFIENEDHVANFFEKCDAALSLSYEEPK